MVDIEVDKKSDRPLYVQIRDHLKTAVTKGELKPGDKLPSVNCMAKRIGVTQATVRRAFEDLTKLGLARSHVGRGTFIEPVKTVEAVDPGDPFRHPVSFPGNRQNWDHMPGRPAGHDYRYVARQLRSGISKGLLDLMRIARQGDLINFSNGIPDPAFHDPGFLKDVALETLENETTTYLTASDSQGLMELRQELCTRYEKKGVFISPDQILITNGSQQAASIVAMDTIEHRRRVIFETPCFQGVPETFNAHGNWVDTVGRDEQGPILDQLEGFSGQPALLYICPDLHNPTGTNLTDERHDALVAWAQKNRGIILSDDIFQDLLYEGPALKSMLTTLGSDQTIVISSISKSLACGLRVGWMISSADRIRAYTRLKRLMDQACPPLMQGMVLNLFKSGRYDHHLERVKSLYRKRRDLLLESLQQLMPKAVSWTRPKGGFSLWVSMPQGYSSIALLLSAIDKGVNFLPGPLFDIDQRFVRSFRLSWAWTDEDQISEGVEILADTIKELLRQPPGDAGLSGLGHFQ